MKKSNNTDGLVQLKEQIQLVLDFIEKMDYINPDYEFNFAGNDIYSSHVEQAFEEVIKIIEQIENGKKPFYTKERLNKDLKEQKDYFDNYE